MYKYNINKWFANLKEKTRVAFHFYYKILTCPWTSCKAWRVKILFEHRSCNLIEKDSSFVEISPTIFGLEICSNSSNSFRWYVRSVGVKSSIEMSDNLSKRHLKTPTSLSDKIPWSSLSMKCPKKMSNNRKADTTGIDPSLTW